MPTPPDSPSERSRAAARPSGEQLWSWVDRDAPELEGHLARHPEDAARVAELRAAIEGLAAAPAERPIEVSGYEVLGSIGRGGMGAVYEAVQHEPRRRVALKVIPSELLGDERRLERFRREANALARLSHPGIATVFGVGRCADGRPYIAMELVRGLTLDRFVAERGLGRRARVELLQRVCEAVGHAHGQGVVHRDLKPANVLVDAAGRPKVLDFGLARIEGEEAHTRVTRPGELCGTLATMSPEQARGAFDEHGPAGDVYQLGLLLFELVAGEPPYRLDGLSLHEAVRRIAQTPPRERRPWRRRLRGELRSIALTALEKDPRRRYENAAELAADLARWLDGRAVEAVRTPAWLALARFARRQAASLSLAALAIALIGLVLFPARLPIPLLPDWWHEGSPFDDLRWRGEVPEVLVHGRWHELLAVEGVQRAYLIGFAQQHAPALWRKRVAEDLVQILNRMGRWTWRSVDLELRDLESGLRRELAGVPLANAGRRRAQERRYSWPFELTNEGPGVRVRFRGRAWELVSVEGVPVLGAQGGRDLYDQLCDRLGRSPGDTIDLELRDPASGELALFRGVERFGAREGGE